MIKALKNIFSVEELRKKIVFTFLLLIVCRIGAYVPVPGINADEIVKAFQFATKGGQNLFQLVDMFTGGAFAKMAIIGLGVMPYITSSIILQLLMALVPSFKREVKENPDQGRRKIGKWTRILTLVLALFQSSMMAREALYLNSTNPGIIYDPVLAVKFFGFPWLFYLLFMVTMTTGTLYLMWLGEQITEKGIGNGVSLIITVGILASLPSTIGLLVSQLNLESQEMGQMTFSSLIVLAAFFIMIVVGTILIIQGMRKVPLQYARRVSTERELKTSDAYIPLKLNYAGVIPVIFASAILMFPATIAQFLGKGSVLGNFASYLVPGTVVYATLYVALIVFFTFFWTASQFQPDQIASDMKRNGAFIPGIRQGKATQDYLEKTMNTITLLGAVSLAFIAILPMIVGRVLHVDQAVSHFFGGTSLLIMVGVVLDTMKQVESHLLMNRYDGFMSRKKAKARL